MRIINLDTPDRKIGKYVTKRRILGSFALVLALSNFEVVNRYWGFWSDDGPMVAVPPGCAITRVEDNHDPNLSDAERLDLIVSKELIESEYVHHQSAANRWLEVIGDTLRNAVSAAAEGPPQYLEYLAMQPEVFTMAESGINIALYAPEGVAVDERLFAELFHASLNPAVDYSQHDEVRQLIECYRQRVIIDKEFAGYTIPVVLAPDKGYCFKHLRFQPTDEAGFCDGHGFTPPLINIQFAGVEVMALRPMLLSTGRSGESANQDISQRIAHEAIHALGVLTDKPFQMQPDERLTELIEELTVNALYPQGVPEAINYPDE